MLIVLLATGTTNDIKNNYVLEVCCQGGIKNAVPEYNIFIVLITGLSAIVTLIAGMVGKRIVALVALAATVLVTISYLIDSIKMLPRMKQEGWDFSKRLLFQPFLLKMKYAVDFYVNGYVNSLYLSNKKDRSFSKFNLKKSV